MNGEEDMVAFRGSDTGVGLTPDQISHLFERFYRVDKLRARALGGSGIGLTIAQSLAQAMGGEIQIESAGPRGDNERNEWSACGPCDKRRIRT